MPFAIAKYEVPQNLWEAVMGSNPSKWKGKRNSVEMLSFDEAQAVLPQGDGADAGGEADRSRPRSIRLPSEAEWEYARPRRHDDEVFVWRRRQAKLDEYGWHTGNAAGNDPPVGAKKPNPWGLYDVHGYLWEWTDRTAARRRLPTEGGRFAAEVGRIAAGGSWQAPSRSRSRMPSD